MLKKFLKKRKILKLHHRVNAEIILNAPFFELNKINNIKSYSNWYSNEIDSIFKAIDRLEEELDIKSSCGDKCSACCSQFIIVNPVEYENIKYNMKSIDKEIKNIIKEKSALVCTDLTQRGYKLTYTVPNDYKEVARLQNGYNYPCPLLIDNECVIYQSRPLTCATYRNYGDREDCYKNKFAPLSYSHMNVDSLMTELMFKGYQVKNNEFNVMAKVLNDIL